MALLLKRVKMLFHVNSAIRQECDALFPEQKSLIVPASYSERTRQAAVFLYDSVTGHTFFIAVGQSCSHNPGCSRAPRFKRHCAVIGHTAFGYAFDQAVNLFIKAAHFSFSAGRLSYSLPSRSFRCIPSSSIII